MLLVLSHPEDLSEEMLTSLDFQFLINKVKAAKPTLWEVLYPAAYSPEQEKWNIHKDPWSAASLCPQTIYGS